MTSLVLAHHEPAARPAKPACHGLYFALALALPVWAGIAFIVWAA